MLSRLSHSIEGRARNSFESWGHVVGVVSLASVVAICVFLPWFFFSIIHQSQRPTKWKISPLLLSCLHRSSSSSFAVTTLLKSAWICFQFILDGWEEGISSFSFYGSQQKKKKKEKTERKLSSIFKKGPMGLDIQEIYIYSVFDKQLPIPGLWKQSFIHFVS